MVRISEHCLRCHTPAPHLQVQPPGPPPHGGVVDAPEGAVGPVIGEAIRLPLDVRVAVEVLKGVLHVHQVHVRHQHV
eukprot:1611057-Pyramimonas_sp.AAC.1